MTLPAARQDWAADRAGVVYRVAVCVGVCGIGGRGDVLVESEGAEDWCWEYDGPGTEGGGMGLGRVEGRGLGRVGLSWRRHPRGAARIRINRGGAPGGMTSRGSGGSRSGWRGRIVTRWGVWLGRRPRRGSPAEEGVGGMCLGRSWGGSKRAGILGPSWRSVGTR